MNLREKSMSKNKELMSNLSAERLLGVLLCAHTGNFGFELILQKKKSRTRRNLLSDIRLVTIFWDAHLLFYFNEIC